MKLKSDDLKWKVRFQFQIHGYDTSSKRKKKILTLKKYDGVYHGE